MKISLVELLKIWLLWNHSQTLKPKILKACKFFGIHYWNYYGTWVRKCEACGKHQRMVDAAGKPKGDVIKWEDFTYR